MTTGTLVVRNRLIVVIGKGATVALGVFTSALLVRHPGTGGLVPPMFTGFAHADWSAGSSAT